MRIGAVGVLAAATAVSLAAAGGLPVAGFAQDTEWNRYTLDGLDGVFVRAETNEGCQGAGVSADAIRESSEAELQEAGVPLLTREEMLASPGLPELRITLECGGGVDGVVGYAVSVRVQQATQMIRDTQITLSEAVTWYTSAVGAAQAPTTAEAMRAALAVKLAEFAEAFSEANAEDEGSE